MAETSTLFCGESQETVQAATIPEPSPSISSSAKHSPRGTIRYLANAGGTDKYEQGIDPSDPGAACGLDDPALAPDADLVAHSDLHCQEYATYTFSGHPYNLLTKYTRLAAGGGCGSCDDGSCGSGSCADGSCGTVGPHIGGRFGTWRLDYGENPSYPADPTPLEKRTVWNKYVREVRLDGGDNPTG